MDINIIGSIFGTTGYDSHTRNLANALYKIANVKLSVPLPLNWNMLVNDAELYMIKKQLPENCINLIITTPHNWKLCTGLGKNIAYCIWEGNKVPKSYIEEMLNPKIDLILVASQHTKDAIMNTINNNWFDIHTKGPEYSTALLTISNKIRIIPHGVDHSLFYKSDKPRKDDLFTFICNKGWRGTEWDRGGVQYVLRAFTEEFKNTEKVKLLLKLNPAYISPQVLHQSLLNMNLDPNHAQVQICLEDTPFNKLLNLYNEGDVYVCATRCEAFNLPGLEAMACSLPTIQTSFGGQIDYMSDLNSSFIDYTLEEVREDLMYEGIQWATPDIIHLRKIMRKMFDYKEDTKKMGEQALEDSKKFTWDNSAKLIVESLNQKI